MMHDENPRHTGADGDVYELDMVIHDRYTSFEYDIDLVRWTDDDHGLPRSQRLTLDTHTAYGLAEEHQMGVDLAVTELGLEEVLGKEIEQVKEQPFQPVTYDVMTFSEDFGADQPASLELLAIQEGRLDTVVLAEGRRREMEYLAMGLEDIHAEHGSEKLLEASHQVAVDQGILEPNQRLFNGQVSPEMSVEVDAPPIDNPYWQFDTLPVQDPEGVALGVSLQMVRFPTVDQTAGQSEITPDTPLEMLEVGQFDTVDQANEFATEFSSYLSPGILEGPELAEAVVGKLEAEPVIWKTLDEIERTAYQENTLTLTYDRSDWSPSPDVEASNPVMAPDFDL